MLINLRNALMGGKRLPYDAEVEYLESTGTQWIDTGVVPTNTTGVLIECTVPTNNSRDNIVVGARQNSSDTRYWIDFDWSTFDTFYFGFGSIQPMAYNSLRQYEGERVQVGMNYQNGRICTINGEKFSNLPISGSLPTITKSIYCFRANHSNPYTYSGKIFSLKITDGLTLVRDFIPVRKGTIGYLYDRVSGRLFGNAGTGDFVLGPDVVPVEYIESTGTQYIDTGIILNDTYGIDINFAPMETASGVSEHGIFGSSVSGSGIRHNVLQIHSSAGGVGLWMPSNTRICNYAITVGEYQHWQINLNDSDEVVIDNVLRAHTHPTTPAECRYPVYLFGRNVANTLKSGSCSKMRLATWMVCDGSGNFIQKWLPVRVGTDATSWEGAMMDVLTRRIYRNQGTGAFTYGNDLKYPIPSE